MKVIVTFCPVTPHVHDISGAVIPLIFLSGESRAFAFKSGATQYQKNVGRMKEVQFTWRGNHILVHSGIELAKTPWPPSLDLPSP